MVNQALPGNHGRRMTEGVKTRAREALKTQRAQGDNFWPRQLVTDLLAALDAAEAQLQGWVEVAGNRIDLVEQLKVEKRALQSEVDYWKRQAVPETVTRVVVVKGSRVTNESFAASWRMFLQDEGRTLKLFASGSGAEASAERSAALGKDLVADLKKARTYCVRCGGAFLGEHECKRDR